MRLYLDACCLNRPFDEQSQLRVHLESEAVLTICEHADQERWIILSSAVLVFELGRIPDPQRCVRTLKLLSVAREHASVSVTEIARAKRLRQDYGLRAFDALHLACSEAMQADAFLTTDDRLLRACHRMPAGELSFAVANPLSWLTDFLTHE